MPYGVDTAPFRDLEERVRALPEVLPDSPRPLEGVLYAYLRAFACLLTLVMAIMKVCVEREEQRRYVARFLPVYDRAAVRLLQLLEQEVREGLEIQSPELIELVHAIRDGQVGFELVALDQAVSESEGSSEPEDHLDTATTVTNSLKQLIEKVAKRKWISSVLHALNEVISIVRGVV